MALSAAQRRQLHSLPVADASFGKSDRFALHFMPEALSVSLTSAQRRQWHFIPIADASIPIGDRYALHGITQTLESGGPIIETFTTTVFVSPTWTVTELPQSVAGGITAEVGSFVFSGLGEYESPVVSLDIGADQLSITASSRLISIQGAEYNVDLSGITSNRLLAITSASKIASVSQSTRITSINRATRTISVS